MKTTVIPLIISLLFVSCNEDEPPVDDPEPIVYGCLDEKAENYDVFADEHRQDSCVWNGKIVFFQAEGSAHTDEIFIYINDAFIESKNFIETVDTVCNNHIQRFVAGFYPPGRYKYSAKVNDSDLLKQEDSITVANVPGEPNVQFWGSGDCKVVVINF